MRSRKQRPAPLSPSERAAKEILTALGFAVAAVPRTSAKTADFVVSGEEPGYVVEVAARRVDEAVFVQPVEVEQTRDPKVMEWLKAAGNQCRTVDPEHQKFWVVWGAAEGPIGAQAQAERINNALYGVRAAIDAMPPHQQFTIYYARPPLFEDHTEIDAVVVFAPGVGIGICPNGFSPRFDDVMQSRLAKTLNALAPSDRVPRGCVVPDTIDRHDEVAVLRYVQNTVGIHTLSFVARDIHWAAGLRIPRSHFES